MQVGHHNGTDDSVGLKCRMGFAPEETQVFALSEQVTLNYSF